MIIVAIVGILAAIMIPACGTAIWRARNRQRAKDGLPPLPKPEYAQSSTSCKGRVVSAVVKDGTLIKVYEDGCEERSL